MAKPRRTHAIGLMDHAGGGNLGDDTTQTAVIQNIRKRWPDARIFGFTMNPTDTEARHGIPAYPLRRRIWDRPGQALPDAPQRPETSGTEGSGRSPVRRLWQAAHRLARKPRALCDELGFLVRSYKAVRQVDTFILSGSGQFLDSWGGPWEYPFTLAKWLLLAKLAGARCCVLNAGAGPLQHPLSRFLVRQALRLTNHVAFRDEPSRALIRQCGYKGQAEVCHDSVYCLDVAVPELADGSADALPLVGLAPMAYCDPRRYCVRDAVGYQRFVDKFAAFAAWLSQRHRVVLFSTDIWFDADTLSDVAARMRSSAELVPAHIQTRRPITSIDTLLPQMAAMDYIVTSRFHGVIFAHLLNIPVVAISHHPKVATLMADLGLSDYCLDIDSFEVAQLEATFERMLTDAPRIKAHLAETAASYRRELNEQFDRLFPV